MDEKKNDRSMERVKLMATIVTLATAVVNLLIAVTKLG